VDEPGRPLIRVSEKGEDLNIISHGSIGTRCIASRTIWTIRTLCTSLSPEQSPFGTSVQRDADPAVI
jgi:hypothetical protein